MELPPPLNGHGTLVSERITRRAHNERLRRDWRMVRAPQSQEESHEARHEPAHESAKPAADEWDWAMF